MDLIAYGANTAFPDEPKFWGLTSVLVSWEALRDNVTRLQDLQATVRARAPAPPLRVHGCMSDVGPRAGKVLSSHHLPMATIWLFVCSWGSKR